MSVLARFITNDLEAALSHARYLTNEIDGGTRWIYQHGRSMFMVQNQPGSLDGVLIGTVTAGVFEAVGT